ncbi:MAG: hypothetical protein JWN26_65 [Candidatus Saccharibacteria bacterium]|nr:hypothetical protein [Candidatus Saccharibacteria bacterium]
MARPVDNPKSNERAGALSLKPSTSVEGTWEVFEKLSSVEQDGIRARATDIVKVVYDFGGFKELVPSAYEAVQLAPLMDELSGPDIALSSAAYSALQQYESNNPQDREYVRAFAADMVKINKFVDAHWEARETLEPEQPVGSEPTERLYQSPWERRYNNIPLKEVLELVSDTPDDIVQNPEGVNIESILIATASAYNTLRHADDVSEDRLLETMYAVESFYQPLLEIIGYDGFGMALKRESTLVRMSRNGGQYDEVTGEKLEVAREMLRALGPPNKFPNTVSEMMSHLFLTDSEGTSVLNDVSGHGIQFGSGLISEQSIDDLEDTLPTLDYNTMRYVWRVKTDTSMAKKIDLENNTRGSDLLGVTVIVPSTELLGYSFGLISGIIMGRLNQNMIPVNATGRDTPLHAKGAKMIDSVSRYAGDLGTKLDEKASINGHEVAKVTFLFTPEGSESAIPVEVQFQTREAREIARAGTAAHAFKEANYEVSAEDLRVLGRLHKRRMKTNEPGLTPLSELAAKELFKYKNRKAMGSAGISKFFQSDQSGMITLRNRQP